MSNSITEQIESVKSETCEHICKYYDNADGFIKAIKGNDPALRQQIIEVVGKELGKHCEVCPLKRL